MARINLPLPPAASDAAQIAAYLERLVGELEYILSNLDAENMTAAYNSVKK